MEIQISNYLALNVLDIILVLISTSIILIIGKKYFWKQILGYIDARQAFIQTELDNARTNRESSEQVLAEYKEQVKDAKNLASDYLDKAKHDAMLERQDILAKAHSEATLIKDKARQDIEKDKAAQAKAIRKEISDVSFEAASKFVKDQLNKDQFDEYIDEFIEQAGDKQWQD